MKSFEKWYKKERQRRRGAPMYSADYRTGWKAALEWMQSRLKFGSKVAYSEADILMAIKKEIREELGE